MLHDPTEIFLDTIELDSTKPRIEEEADQFAADALVPGGLSEIVARPTRRDIFAIAARVGVAPGIIVGQLQHSGLIGFQSQNPLKRRYRWDGSNLRT